MRAMLVNELGKPDTLTPYGDGLTAPWTGEIVRVAVHAAGCNFADTLMISGALPVQAGIARSRLGWKLPARSSIRVKV